MSDTAFWTCDDGDEELTYDNQDEAVEAELDSIIDSVGIDKLPETIEVFGYRRMELDPENCRSPLEDLLEWLDEEYGNPNGDYTGPTQSMQDAEKEFIKKVLAEYSVWQCEPTGEVVKVNSMDWIKENAPEWLLEKEKGEHA